MLGPVYLEITARGHEEANAVLDAAGERLDSLAEKTQQLAPVSAKAASAYRQSVQQIERQLKVTDKQLVTTEARARNTAIATSKVARERIPKPPPVPAVPAAATPSAPPIPGAIGTPLASPIPATSVQLDAAKVSVTPPAIPHAKIPAMQVTTQPTPPTSLDAPTYTVGVPAVPHGDAPTPVMMQHPPGTYTATPPVGISGQPSAPETWAKAPTPAPVQATLTVGGQAAVAPPATAPTVGASAPPEVEQLRQRLSQVIEESATTRKILHQIATTTDQRSGRDGQDPVSAEAIWDVGTTANETATQIEAIATAARQVQTALSSMDPASLDFLDEAAEAALQQLRSVQMAVNAVSRTLAALPGHARPDTVQHLAGKSQELLATFSRPIAYHAQTLADTLPKPPAETPSTEVKTPSPIAQQMRKEISTTLADVADRASSLQQQIAGLTALGSQADETADCVQRVADAAKALQSALDRVRPETLADVTDDAEAARQQLASMQVLAQAVESRLADGDAVGKTLAGQSLGVIRDMATGPEQSLTNLLNKATTAPAPVTPITPPPPSPPSATTPRTFTAASAPASFADLVPEPVRSFGSGTGPAGHAEARTTTAPGTAKEPATFADLVPAQSRDWGVDAKGIEPKETTAATNPVPVFTSVARSVLTSPQQPAEVTAPTTTVTPASVAVDAQPGHDTLPAAATPVVVAPPAPTVTAPAAVSPAPAPAPNVVGSQPTSPPAAVANAPAATPQPRGTFQVPTPNVQDRARAQVPKFDIGKLIDTATSKPEALTKMLANLKGQLMLLRGAGIDTAKALAQAWQTLPQDLTQELTVKLTQVRKMLTSGQIDEKEATGFVRQSLHEVTTQHTERQRAVVEKEQTEKRTTQETDSLRVFEASQKKQHQQEKSERTAVANIFEAVATDVQSFTRDLSQLDVQVAYAETGVLDLAESLSRVVTEMSTRAQELARPQLQEIASRVESGELSPKMAVQQGHRVLEQAAQQDQTEKQTRKRQDAAHVLRFVGASPKEASQQLEKLSVVTKLSQKGLLSLAKTTTAAVQGLSKESQERARAGLEKIATKVESGKLTEQEAGAAVTRLLEKIAVKDEIKTVEKTFERASNKESRRELEREGKEQVEGKGPAARLGQLTGKGKAEGEAKQQMAKIMGMGGAPARQLAADMKLLDDAFKKGDINLKQKSQGMQQALSGASKQMADMKGHADKLKLVLAGLVVGILGMVRSGMAGTTHAEVLGLHMQFLMREVASLFVEQINAVIQGVRRATQAFRALSGDQQRAIGGFITTAAALGLAAKAAPLLVAGITSFIEAAKYIALTVNPVLLVAGALVLLAATTEEGRRGLMRIVDAVAELGPPLLRLIEPFANLLVPVIAGAVVAVTALAGAMDEIIRTFSTPVLASLGDALAVMGGVALQVGRSIMEFFTGLQGNAVTLQAVLSGLVQVLQPVIAAWASLGSLLSGPLVAAVQVSLGMLQGLINLWQGAFATAMRGWGAAIEWWFGVLQTGMDALTAVFQPLIAALQGVLDFIAGMVRRSRHLVGIREDRGLITGGDSGQGYIGDVFSSQAWSRWWSGFFEPGQQPGANQQRPQALGQIADRGQQGRGRQQVVDSRSGFEDVREAWKRFQVAAARQGMADPAQATREQQAEALRRIVQLLETVVPGSAALLVPLQQLLGRPPQPPVIGA